MLPSKLWFLFGYVLWEGDINSPYINIEIWYNPSKILKKLQNINDYIQPFKIMTESM